MSSSYARKQGNLDKSLQKAYYEKNSIMQIFKESFLRKKREEQKISLEDMAAKTSLTQERITEIEGLENPFKTEYFEDLRKILGVLGTKIGNALVENINTEQIKPRMKKSFNALRDSFADLLNSLDDYYKPGSEDSKNK